MAVESYDDRIDPVGACVGVNGSRIRGIVRELRDENIDVMSYTSNQTLFVQRALSPAKVSSIDLLEEEQRAEVYLRPEEVPLAIGKNAYNIKLASALTGLQIEVFRDVDEAAEEDIYLSEFSDEIDEWVIDTLEAIGCNTARLVLMKSREELIRQTDLEEGTIDHVMRILASEFDFEELKEMNIPNSNLKVLNIDITAGAATEPAIVDLNREQDIEQDELAEPEASTEEDQ